MFRKHKRPHDPLDDMLFQWPDGSPFTVRHMLRSVEVKGITGSGKSSGSGAHFLRSLIAHPRATLLIIAQKPEEKEVVQEMFARAGKRDRLIVFEEGGRWRTNFFETEMKAGADARGLVEFLTTLGEALDAGQAGGHGSNDQFWRKSEERLTYNTVEAIRQGTGSISAPAMLDFITTALYNPQTLSDEALREAWKKKFHYQVMQAGAAREKNQIEAADWQVLQAYWSQEFVYMDDKPRSSILAGVMNTLHNANTGLSRLMTSTTTNVTPTAFDEGYSGIGRE
jgi:hypothetical protein